jgi:hypothetical protein
MQVELLPLKMTPVAACSSLGTMHVPDAKPVLPRGPDHRTQILEARLLESQFQQVQRVARYPELLTEDGADEAGIPNRAAEL